MLRETVIDFSQPLRDWDGFGINYVETAQTRDYQADPQEYGGLSTLGEADRQEIVELIFGDDGLKPNVLKMFHDCWHQPEPGPDNIYSAKVNAIIPWAAVQTNTWVGGDPNPGTAIRVADGRYTVERGYYFYKQVCRAGQAEMAVTRVRANDSELALIGFARNGTRHPDAFVVINIGEEAKGTMLEIPASTSTLSRAFRSSSSERYVAVGEFAVGTASSAHGIAYQAPPRSVTTFFGAD